MARLEAGRDRWGGIRTEVPVLVDGDVVATLRPAAWRQGAEVTVGDREWVYGKRRGRLTARWRVDPEESSRMSAGAASRLRGDWSVDLGGTVLDVRSASRWKGTHAYGSGGARVAVGGTTGGLAPRPTLDVHEDLTLDQQVFLLWVEMHLQRRDTGGD